MNKITIKYKFSNITRDVTQLTTVKDVNEYIDLEIESAEIKEIINERGVNEHNRTDSVDHLMNMYQHINNNVSREIKLGNGTLRLDGFYSKAMMNREEILEMKREKMVDCVKKYGQVWMNENGSYSPPIRNYDIVE